MTHTDIKKQIILKWSAEKKGRLFSNETGAAFREKFLIRYGLHPGSSDLIGFTIINGNSIFTGCEVKTLEYKYFSIKQIKWINMLINFNCLSYCALQFEDSYKLIRIVEKIDSSKKFNAYGLL